MKHIQFYVIALLFIPMISMGQSAGDHLSELNSVFSDLKKDTWKYLKSVTRGKSANKVEKTRAKLLETYVEQKRYVKGVRPYNDDNSLKDAMSQYLDLSYKVLKEDFDAILDMEAIAEQSYDAMEAYILANEKANDKLEDAADELEAVVNSYAANNNINLVKDEGDKTAEKIERASRALGYYNDVYLIFFRVYMQEKNVLDAHTQSDLNALEQNNNALKSIAEEQLQKLDTMSTFEGDASLIGAARKIIRYYKLEAERDFPKYIDFYVKKDNYDKAQKIMDSKKKKDMTEEDVNTYNKAVEEYNKAVNDYNAVIEKMNENRSDQLESWNESVEKYFDKHN